MTECFLLPCAWWSDFLSNLFATLIGVAFGIPVALWLNRRQTKIEQEFQSEVQRKEQSGRINKIIDLLENELQVNLFQLGANKSPAGAGMSRVVFVSGFKDELWKTFAEGGEIEWINDIDILDSLATSYHYIARLKFLENLYFELNRTDPRDPSVNELIQNLGDLDRQATTTLEETVKKIKQYRERLNEAND